MASFLTQVSSRYLISATDNLKPRQGLPKGYKAEFKGEETDAYYGSEELGPRPQCITTTQPPFRYGATKANEPDGWTECILVPKVKDIILRVPNFPKRIRHPANKRYRIGASSVSPGLGMFATTDVGVGEPIMYERPLVIAPIILLGFRSQSELKGLSNEQIIQVSLADMELRFEQLMLRLPTEDMASYKALFNSHRQDGSGPLDGIFRTNCLEAPPLIDPDQKGKAACYGGVGKDISRINHR